MDLWAEPLRVKLCFLNIFMMVNTSSACERFFISGILSALRKLPTPVQRLRVIVNSVKITRFGFVFGKISRALFLSVWFLSRLFTSVLFAAVAANLLFSKINVCSYTTQEPTFKQSTLVVLTSTRGNYVSVKSQKEDSVRELKVFACYSYLLGVHYMER